MKGFQQKTESTGKFFVVKHNCICEESTKERAGFEPVEVMNPQTKQTSIKFIRPYDFLEAMVTKIEWRDTEDKYEQRYMSWKIHLDANGESGTLEIPFNSRIGDRFMKMAENIDFTKPVEFRAWRDADDKTAFIIKQDGQSIPQRYTKADPGDCPPPVQTFGGKWNFDSQSAFLHKQMMTVVLPRVDAANNNGHHTDYSEPEPAQNTPAVNRETLEAEIYGVCKELNAAGDQPQWSKPRLTAFINEQYSVEDGMNSLSTPFMVELKAMLNKRLIDLEIPF